jgi:hypothetical protein
MNSGSQEAERKRNKRAFKVSKPYLYNVIKNKRGEQIYCVVFHTSDVQDEYGLLVRPRPDQILGFLSCTADLRNIKRISLPCGVSHATAQWMARVEINGLKYNRATRAMRKATRRNILKINPS